MMKTMKAIRVYQRGERDQLILKTDFPVPDPKDDEVLVRIHAAGINSVDAYIRRGLIVDYPGATLPYTPGFDGAGTVEKVGASVKDFKKNDRVIVVWSKSGTYAEYCTAKANHVCPLHNNLSFYQGAAIGVPYYTALISIFDKAKVKPTETVMVHGASGGVGIAAVQTLKAHGCHVIGTAGTPEGMELVKSRGADKVYNHKDENYTDNLGKVDVILEMLANVNLPKDLKAVEPRGRIVVIGCRDVVTVDMRVLMAKEISILGAQWFMVKDDEWGPLHDAIKKGQEDNWLKPVVNNRTYSLEEAAQAHFDVNHNSGTMGKLVVNIR